jgi:hypothetical protein
MPDRSQCDDRRDGSGGRACRGPRSGTDDGRGYGGAPRPTDRATTTPRLSSTSSRALKQWVCATRVYGASSHRDGMPSPGSGPTVTSLSGGMKNPRASTASLSGGMMSPRASTVSLSNNMMRALAPPRRASAAV